MMLNILLKLEEVFFFSIEWHHGLQKLLSFISVAPIGPDLNEKLKKFKFNTIKEISFTCHFVN